MGTSDSPHVLVHSDKTISRLALFYANNDSIKLLVDQAIKRRLNEVSKKVRF